MIKFHVSLKKAMDSISHPDKKFATMIEHGSMKGLIFMPKELDNQKPHKKDEVYFVVNGYGEFIYSTEKIKFDTGDLIFVPAGVQHKFINYSKNLTLWAVFYGSEVGEASKQQ